MTSVTTPVRPSAPAVPQNSSGSDVGVTVDDLLRRVQRERLDVVGDAAVDVVVLPVHVGRDRAADRDEAGAGRDRDEVAERQRGADQGVDAHAGRDPRDAGVGIDVDATARSSAAAVEHGAAGVLRGVAIAPAEPAGDQPPAPAPREQRIDVVDVVGSDDGGGGRAVRPQPVSSSTAVSHGRRART